MLQVLLKQLEMRKLESEKAMEDTKREITDQTKAREEELANLREEVLRAERMVEWREERQRQKLVARSEAEGDLDERGELALMSQSKQLELRDKSLQAASKSTLDKEMTMEEAFMQIRRATGINTLEEMVEKFLGQTANKEALQQVLLACGDIVGAGVCECVCPRLIGWMNDRRLDIGPTAK